MEGHSAQRDDDGVDECLGQQKIDFNMGGCSLFSISKASHYGFSLNMTAP